MLSSPASLHTSDTCHQQCFCKSFSLSCLTMQVTLERVALLFMMVRAPAFVTGKFTCAPYAAMLRPMKPELDAMLGGLEQFGQGRGQDPA